MQTVNAWTEHLDQTRAFYDGLVGQYGHDPRACDYGSSASQMRKFQVLAEVAPLTGKRVLDVGCGFADFADVLTQRWGMLDYAGIDISSEMINTARKLRRDARLQVMDVLTGDPGGRFDFVFANGIFYRLTAQAPTRMQALIRRMFDLCDIGVAFTSLSTWAPQMEPGEFYANPLETLDFCRMLTRRVMLRHDYLPHDFAIYMFREPE